jgi:REP element-mobilizing transposase RayT
MEGGKFKNKYRAESTRWKGWDYSANAYYFVTICTKDKKYYFGDIVNEKMILSEIGKIAARFWLEIPKHFPFVNLGEYIIMPNHLHGLLMIYKDDNPVETRFIASQDSGKDTINQDTINRVSTMGGITGKHNPMLSSGSLSKIIRWYKGRTTFEINKQFPNSNFSWQSRFYDRIIRNDDELNSAREYIISNLFKWNLDKDNIDNLYM